MHLNILHMWRGQSGRVGPGHKAKPLTGKLNGYPTSQVAARFGLLGNAAPLIYAVALQRLIISQGYMHLPAGRHVSLCASLIRSWRLMTTCTVWGHPTYNTKCTTLAVYMIRKSSSYIKQCIQIMPQCIKPSLYKSCFITKSTRYWEAYVLCDLHIPVCVKENLIFFVPMNKVCWYTVLVSHLVIRLHYKNYECTIIM